MISLADHHGFVQVLWRWLVICSGERTARRLCL